MRGDSPNGNHSREHHQVHRAAAHRPPLLVPTKSMLAIFRLENGPNVQGTEVTEVGITAEKKISELSRSMPCRSRRVKSSMATIARHRFRYHEACESLKCLASPPRGRVDGLAQSSVSAPLPGMWVRENIAGQSAGQYLAWSKWLLSSCKDQK